MNKDKLKTNKILILLIIIIFLSILSFVVAKQSIIKAIESGNLLWINTGDKYDDSALTGWYPVEKWEVETCTRGQTSDFKNSDQAEQGDFSRNSLIIDTAITIQGTQHNIRPDYKEYEIAWYIQPFNKETDYEIQYEVNNKWKTLPALQGKVAGPQNGDQGYYAWSGNYNISKIKITSSDSFLTVPMVQQS